MKNEVREHCWTKSVPVPEGTKSGDPVIIGVLPGVAVIDRQANGKATVKFSTGSYRMTVIGKKEAEEKQIKVGEKVFLKEGKLSADTGGTLWGYVMEEVAKGKTAEVEVKLAIV
jgi:predicted RecA/RadA family phage recombinase